MTSREEIHALVNCLPEGALDVARQVLASLAGAAEGGSGAGVIGLFAEDAALMDQIVQDAMRQRETRPWRAG